jgi:DNA-binding SARP family transcriptional activator
LRGLLERACGPGRPALLVRSDSAYGLALPPGARCDTVTFQGAVSRWRRVRASGDRAAEVAALREALGGYGGDLLPEDGPADWASAARDQYRRQATELSRALAAAELARGEIDEAIAAAESCLALDPFDDTAWQVLLCGYERAGAPAKAAEARRRYAAMLATLGLDAPVGLTGLDAPAGPAGPVAPVAPPERVGAGARRQPVRMVTSGRKSPTPRQPPGGRAPHRRPS